MTKIGTAHVEIKPVLNEDALEVLAKTINDRVAAAVVDALRRGLAPLSKDDVALVND
ncbi:hypothetical protein [Cellulosimicrobium cellulans]|uniref:hypothetical protein n=1 Tax=Cellulosimicrobium cellulans TaxID=1710 RepID=UPI003C56F5B8